MILKLTGGKEAIIDDNMAHLAEYAWCTSGGSYAYRRETYAPKKSRKLYLHHAIMGRQLAGLEIDHIDRNPLNNTRANLRVVDSSTNGHNVPVRSHSTTGLQGVSPEWGGKGYYSRITVRGKKIYLGYFLDPQKAHETYIQAKTAHGLL